MKREEREKGSLSPLVSFCLVARDLLAGKGLLTMYIPSGMYIVHNFSGFRSFSHVCHQASCMISLGIWIGLLTVFCVFPCLVARVIPLVYDNHQGTALGLSSRFKKYTGHGVITLWQYRRHFEQAKNLYREFQYIKHERTCLTTFPSTEDGVENTTRSGVFSTNIKVFGNMTRHCIECLIQLLNRN